MTPLFFVQRGNGKPIANHVRDRWQILRQAFWLRRGLLRRQPGGALGCQIACGVGEFRLLPAFGVGIRLFLPVFRADIPFMVASCRIRVLHTSYAQLDARAHEAPQEETN